MPKIKITGRLPKAVLGFETTDTTTMAPASSLADNAFPQISFTKGVSGMGTGDEAPPEMTSEEMLQEAKDKNYQNWMQNPQNQMSTASWAQPFNEKFFGLGTEGEGMLPKYDSSKFYDSKGKEVKSGSDDDSDGLNWGTKAKNWVEKTSNKIHDALEGPAKLAGALQTGVIAGNAIASYIDNQKAAEQAKRKQLKSRFTAPVVNPQGTVGSRGDYTQTGQYDPRRYVVNKGMYTDELTPGLGLSEYGGELAHMAYGGGIIEDAVPDMPLDLISIKSPTQPSSILSDNPDAVSTEVDYILPVQNFKITSGYGNRKAPKAGASTNHNGLDLAVPLNTDVFAPMNGVVKSIWNDGKGGNQLIIEHEDGSKTGYAHLNSYKVKVGDNVGKGQVIAFSGNSGNSTGPHLHFTYRNAAGDLQDPTSIFDFGTGTRKQSNDPTVTNNPLNIHYGDFTKQYGATLGGEDNGGYIAQFSSPEVGVKAAKDLLMGGGYAGAGLTISQARNKWVSGNPNTTNPSTSDIVKAMGGDKKLNQLSSAEINKLLLQFGKWENSKSPDIIKNYTFKDGGETNTSYTYNEGGEYELTEDEIRDILNNGGDVQFI